ncbi:hypothetical protein BLA9940_05210 [Burkholderia aenigmatica]|uniref:Immunity protein 43 domain-containing protein n=2 Tax=Burkholderiaceae TaxID=119060 RepID=A0A6J5JJI2_9BURK|nr:hypothetical protein CVS37_27020 [Burkholderia lata]CAB3971411.1 hypothetical protein BLA3211_06440 [Burkholderia aenigmatica]VWC87165.1 hypothetical protein BLA9940_05210 [Burkholderia aenigmatica]
MLNGALYDRYYPDAKRVEVGYFPWYANPSRRKAHEPFPAGVVFITEEARCDFDVRSDLGFYYLISERFGAALSALRVPMVDVAPVEILSLAGERVSGSGYCVSIFPSFQPDEVDGGESAFVTGKFGCIERIRKLVVSSDFSCPIFKLAGMVGSSNSLICSGDFRDEAVRRGIKGIEFLDVERVDWPAVKPV